MESYTSPDQYDTEWLFTVTELISRPIRSFKLFEVIERDHFNMIKMIFKIYTYSYVWK